MQTEPIPTTATEGVMPVTRNYAATFECLGVYVPPTIGANAKCDCPFCGKTGHFFINVTNGLWGCKVCQREGNLFNFLEQISDHWHEHTTTSRFAELAALRGIPAEAFKDWGIGFNGITEEWLYPAYSDKGTVRDVRRWDRHKMKSVTGCNSQLFGLYKLANSTENRKRRTWICEGENDAVALRWLLLKCGYDEIVVAVPGAGIFKSEWPSWFHGLDVIFCYDNDKPGDDGSQKASKALTPYTKRQRFLNWPELLPTGWDLNDHVRRGLEEKKHAKTILYEIESYLKDYHRRTPPSELPPEDAVPEGPPVPFTEVLSVFKKWVKMDRDFIDALIISLAVALGNDLPGEPLWFYVIGAPGGGKTLILLSMAKSDKCIFESSFKAKSLLSGFNAGGDPSLLPMFNGHTAVVKDGTTLLATHPDERREAYAVLRDAYDGSVKRTYANGVVRKYDNLHFNMLIGVTPAIRGDNLATMGERFLTIEMKETEASVREKIIQVMNNSMLQKAMNDDLQGIATRFLNQTVTPESLPRIPPSFTNRIAAMVQLTAILRAGVDRDRYDRSLPYRPSPETGTRIAAQFVKLVRVIAVVLGKPEVDNDVIRLLRKVMADTCVGFHLDVTKAMIRNNNEPMTMGELSNASMIGMNTLQKRMEDLVVLGVVRSVRDEHTVPPTTRYLLTERLVSLWEESKGNSTRLGQGEGI